MTTSNTTPATTPATTVKAEQATPAPAKKAKKAVGTRRVAGNVNPLISRFVAGCAVPVTAMTGIKAIALKKADSTTPFGHENGTLSIAREIDMALVAMPTKGIDSKVLISACLKAVVTTSKAPKSITELTDKHAAKFGVKLESLNEAKRKVLLQAVQADFTFTKVASHLKGFNTSLAHHAKYLKQRMSAKGYTQAEIKSICDSYFIATSPVSTDIISGQKAAKISYKAKLQAKAPAKAKAPKKAAPAKA